MKYSAAWAALVLPLALVACGGGGGGSGSDASTSSVNASAEGAYSGTVSPAGAVNAFQSIILEDGSFWSLYGRTSSGTNVFSVMGFVQGQRSSVSSGSSTSTNARDFYGSFPSTATTVSSTIVGGVSITGTTTRSSGTSTFTGEAVPANIYNYNTPANVASIAGPWALSLLTGETANVNISNTGALGGLTNKGCSLSGTVAARPSGKNVFNVSVTFGSAPCALAGQTVSGIGVMYTVSATQSQLMVTLVDSSRTYGTGAFGVR